MRHGFFSQALFRRIHQKIRLNQNLIIHPVNSCHRVVVCNQIGNAVNQRCVKSAVRKEALHQLRAFRLLMLAVRIAVFFPTKRTGNIVKDCCRLQQKLRLFV